MAGEVWGWPLYIKHCWRRDLSDVATTEMVLRGWMGAHVQLACQFWPNRLHNLSVVSLSSPLAISAMKSRWERRVVIQISAAKLKVMRAGKSHPLSTKIISSLFYLHLRLGPIPLRHTFVWLAAPLTETKHAC